MAARRDSPPATGLRQRGVDDHIIFEKHRIGHSWRSERWDSFCLVTPNHQCRLPGHHYDGDVDLRKFALEGVKLYGFVEGIDFEKFTLRQDLADKLDSADRSYNGICQRIDDYIAEAGIDAPEEPHYTPVWVPETEPTELNFAENNITSIVWCIGFHPDFKFIKLPVFNMRGFPETDRGVTEIPGLYFLGLPWQHTWGSARFSGIAEDADYITEKIRASIPEPVYT